MNPKEKAWDLLDKMNNSVITKEEWYNASDYAKNDLKRKVNIVIDEVIKIETLIDEEIYVDSPSYLNYWLDVKKELKNI
jgi:hypothetical protein